MADKHVKLKDSDGNTLYPEVGNIDPSKLTGLGRVFLKDDTNGYGFRINVGRGLAQYGIDATTSQLGLIIGKGLGFDTWDKLQVHIGNGLYYDSADSVCVKLGSGLKINSSGGIEVNLGSGLQFNAKTGKIELTEV